MDTNKMDKKQLQELNKSVMNAALKAEQTNKELAQELDRQRDDKRAFFELVFNKSIKVLALLAVLFLIGYLINKAIGASEQANGVYAVCGTLATFLREFLSGRTDTPETT